ncbi:WD40-repeat-containing domain protein [Melampsora americana]|nr:WD40-repeat-containing domain protein [Melampsora americana]
MQTADEQKLFQSDAQLKTADLRLQKSLDDKKPSATNGYPIVIASKPLKIIVEGDDVYVAQNGFVAQRIDLKTGSVKGTFKGHAGPVTSIAICDMHTPQGLRKLLITGSWDKTVKVWDIETQIQLSSSGAHQDFVKSVEMIQGLGLFASGSTDRDILLWDIKTAVDTYDWAQINAEHRARKSASRNARCQDRMATVAPVVASADVPKESSIKTSDTSEIEAEGSNGSSSKPTPPPLYEPILRVGMLKSHTRPVDALACHPICSIKDASIEGNSLPQGRDTQKPHLLVSGDTMGALKVWCLRPTEDRAQPIKNSLEFTSPLHQTSINSIQIVKDDDLPPDVRPTARLWTASSDHSVLLSILDLTLDASVRVMSVLRLEQPYYIRCALQLPSQIVFNSMLPNWLITGSTDEGIRVYDLDQIDDEVNYTSAILDHRPKSSIAEKKLQHAWFGRVDAHWHEVTSLGIWYDQANLQSWVISASLDGTLRKWEVGALKKRFVVQESTPKTCVEPISEKTDMKLSAEEEAELAELMESMD